MNRSPLNRICVFCGSSSGADPSYAQAARRLGLALVERGIGLVYGGGHVGLMGEIADSVLGAGGEAIGVMPRRWWSARSRTRVSPACTS